MKPVESVAARMLAEELKRRNTANKRYSMRAFARDLDLSAPFLHRVLRGERRLSLDVAHKIAAELSWSDWDRERFVIGVEVETAGGERGAAATRQQRRLEAQHSYEPLPPQSQFFLSRWHYPAICELIRVLPPPHDGSAIGKRLGIGPIAATAAVERLVHAGFLRWDGNRLKKSKPRLAAGGYPSKLVRSYHRSMLDKAALAMGEDPYEACDFSGVTMPLDPKKLAEARALIARFRRDLAELVGGEDASSVYHLSVQLFRLDDPPGATTTTKLGERH